MTLAIAWGTPYYAGGTPGKAPFVPGTQGVRPRALFIYEGFAFGLVAAPGYAVASVAHTYAPADGSPEYLVATYYLSASHTFEVIDLGEAERDGVHTFTASVDYVPLPTRLVLVATPDNDPGNDWYGAAAWHEETAEPPVSVFWTRFINSKEVTE